MHILSTSRKVLVSMHSVRILGKYCDTSPRSDVGPTARVSDYWYSLKPAVFHDKQFQMQSRGRDSMSSITCLL